MTQESCCCLDTKVCSLSSGSLHQRHLWMLYLLHTPNFPTLLSFCSSSQDCKCHIHLFILCYFVLKLSLSLKSRWSLLDIRKAFSTLKIPNELMDVQAGRRNGFGAWLFLSKCNALCTPHLLFIINTFWTLLLVGSLKLASRFMTHGRMRSADVLSLITHVEGMTVLLVPGGKYQVSIAQLCRSVYQSFPWMCLCWSARTAKWLIVVSVIIYLWGKGNCDHGCYQCSCSFKNLYFPPPSFLES